jgi:ankyrin repeat protein
MSSPPWDVQLNIFNDLLPEARLEKDHTKRDYARLQLAACHHIGFGCDQDAAYVISHLEGAIGNDRTAKTLYPQTIQALRNIYEPAEARVVQRPSRDMDHPSAELSFQQKIAIACQSVRLGEKIAQARFSRAHWKSPDCFHEDLIRMGGTQNDDKSRELVELRSANGLVVEKDVRQYLLDLTSSSPVQTMLGSLSSGNDGTLIDKKSKPNGWPTPMHWLVAVPERYLPFILAPILRSDTGSIHGLPRMRHFERRTQDILALPELCLELFGTPLHWAVRSRNLLLASLLLDAGADIDARWHKESLLMNDLIDEKRPLSYSALDIAVMWHFPELVELLLSRGAATYGGYHFEKHHCVNLIGARVPTFGRHMIHGSMIQAALVSTIQVLEKFGQNLDQRNSSGESTFAISVGLCDQEVYILEVLKLKKWTEAQSSLERLLHSVCKDAAIRRSHTERLKILLGLVENPNVVDHRGLNALHYAALASSSALIQALLEDSRVDPTLCTREGHTALTLAAQAGAESAVTTLWNAGANIDQCDEKGQVPLQYAVEARQLSLTVHMVQTLKASISWNHPDIDRASTVLFSATINSERETSVLKDLLDGCPILKSPDILNKTTANNWTVLHEAAWYGDFVGLCALIEAGASLNISSTRKWGNRRRGTPYEVAVRRSESLKSLGKDGWTQSSIEWIRNGDRARWNAYLDNLSKISAHLAGLEPVI